MTMKLSLIWCALLLSPGLVLAQTSSQKSDSSSSNSDLATEVKALREALLQTQEQVALQEREIETLRGERAKADPAPSVGNEAPSGAMHVATYTAIAAPGRPYGTAPGVVSADTPMQPAVQNQEKGNPKPLGLSILATPYLLQAGSWTLKIYSAPPIPRTTSPRTSLLYRTATRRRAT